MWNSSRQALKQEAQCYNQPVIEQFRFNLFHECHLTHDAKVIVGVSGGPDSLALLNLLLEAGLKPVVAHFNHHLRLEADDDASFVEETARKEGCEFVLGGEAIAELARNQKKSIETVAREERYAFLFSQAVQHQACAVIVGHHADDQVETILQHIIRGSGLDGLHGMGFTTYLSQYSTEIALVRPLLSFWRTQIDAYCSSHDLTPRKDATNDDFHYRRNRIRGELIPLLETYNPQIKKRLWSLSQIVGSASTLNNEVTRQVFTTVCLESHPDFIVFDLPVLRKLEPGLMDSILRKTATLLEPGAEDLSWELFRSARIFLQQGKNFGEKDLGDQIRMLVSQDRAYIALKSAQIVESSWPVLPNEVDQPLAVPGVIQLANGFYLETFEMMLNSHQAVEVPTDNNWAYLDADRLEPGGLRIRCPRPGDRIQPLGMGIGSKKLSDYFNGQKLPLPARQVWPLVLNGDSIAWVVGKGISHPYRVTNVTRRIIRIHLAHRG